MADAVFGIECPPSLHLIAVFILLHTDGKGVLLSVQHYFYHSVPKELTLFSSSSLPCTYPT